MKDFPVIKVTIFFIVGIIVQSLIPLSLKLNFLVFGISLILLFTLLLIEKNSPVKSGSSAVILLIVALMGYTSGNVQQVNRIFLPDSYDVIRNFQAYGKIVNIDLPREDGFSFLLRTDSIKSSAGTIKINTNLQCNIYETEYQCTYNNLSPGNSIYISGTYRKGREIRNPGEFDYNRFLHNKNICGILSSYSISDIKIINKEEEAFGKILHTIRKNLDNIISDLHTEETKALLRGLILANRNEIDYEITAQFINAGVVHILSVSGLHVAFIALIFYTLFGRLNQYLRAAFTVIGILLFMFITGIPASVFRSSVMAIIVICAFLTNRTTNIYNSLAVSALIILIINPLELFDAGFQLSFSAVFSIAYFYPIIRRQILKIDIRSKSIKNILLFSAVSLSAQIGTIPFTLFYFGKLSLIAIFANLLVIPLSGYIIGTAIVTFAIYPFSVQAASVYAAANNLLSHLLFLIVKYSGTVKYAFIEIRSFSFVDTIIFYLFLFGGVILLRHISSYKLKFLVILLIVMNIGIFTSLDDTNILSNDKLNIYMIDVGQGDSFLIKFPGGKTALIDAGNAAPFYDSGERIILPLLQNFGINKIDFAFISHIDADHFNGFNSVIDKCRINKIFKPKPVVYSEKEYLFEQYLKSRKISVEYYREKSIKINNTEIYILNDSCYDANINITSNNRSGILKINYGKTSFLFTGDLEKSGETYYSEYYGEFLNSDVLKIGHHGSKSGSSGEFISLVSPQISLISCGVKNMFNHPSDIIINRLAQSGSQIYRTDLDGGILLQSDGYQIKKIDWK